MATLDSFREAAGEPIQLDLANGYIADIRLNAGDINGRTITVELTDNGTPITDTTGITVALAYNTSPGSGLGDRVSMPAVFGTPTATYRVAVPRKALQHAGAILMGIEVSVNGTKTCSRNFHGIVERAVFDATAPDAQDQMGVLDKLIDDATTAINKAVSAAGEAKDAADAATHQRDRIPAALRRLQGQDRRQRGRRRGLRDPSRHRRPVRHRDRAGIVRRRNDPAAHPVRHRLGARHHQPINRKEPSWRTRRRS